MNEWVLKAGSNDITLEDLFLAYYRCRKNKRNKLDCLEFDLDYESNLIKLWEEIKKEEYEISPLSVFIVDKPVKREIFAASFRDRVVHHLIVMKLEPLFEKEFIYDSYSCRVGRGTHFGINRTKKFIRRCTNNYKEDAFVLKLDISGYFMSINKLILTIKLEKFIKDKYNYADNKALLWLCHKLLLNDPTLNCIRKSHKDKWNDLPNSKSLFYSKENCGLPIGNYTNQVFANFYLNSFDHFVKSELNVKHYGRYVDDFLLISSDKNRLKEYILKIRKYLKEELDLDIHPRKIYLQNTKHGVEFLGVYIKHWRSYVTPRIKNNLYLLINQINEKLDKSSLTNKEKELIRSRLNSYLGILIHSNAFSLRNVSFQRLKGCFWEDFNYDFSKVIIKTKFHK